MVVYQLIPTKKYIRKVSKFIKGNFELGLKITQVSRLISEDPFNQRLATHKVILSSYGLVYSSRVTKDLRIIWYFNEESQIEIILIDVGGHTGSKAVY